MLDLKIGKRFFVLMRPLHFIPFIDIGYVSSLDQEKWVECAIVELDYRVIVQAVEPGYGRESFYITDFRDLVREGIIIEKTSENQHVEEIELGREYVGPNMYVVHSGYIVTT